MTNNYAETKKELDRIRNEYGCQGEVIFRTALQYVVEHGQNTFNENGFVENWLTMIDVKHDKAEAEGKNLFIARHFERAFIECAKEIAKVDAYTMLIYIQKEVWLGHEGGIDYNRAVTLLQACMCNLEQWNDYQNHLTLGEFEDIGFDDDEIIELKFGYILETREDENND